MLSEDHLRRILKLLFKMACEVEPVASSRLAAAIVYKKDIVCFGINKRKSDPFQKKFGKNTEAIFQHAENRAIKNALRFLNVDELEKSTIFIARAKHPSTWDKGFVQGLARPCGNFHKGCMSAINFFGIKNIVYTLDEQGYAVI